MNDHLDLLGGAERTRTRARGFIESWKPQAKTVALLEQVDAILEEYRNYLPMTCRQIFYRLVGNYGFDKTDLAYGRLCEVLTKARRAQRIRMSAIRDDGNERIEPIQWQDEGDFLEYCRGHAQTFRLDRQDGQDVRLFVMCEAAGMVQAVESRIDQGILDDVIQQEEAIRAKLVKRLK